jgi:Zn-dependent peptidase ImmA (M78 family)
MIKELKDNFIKNGYSVVLVPKFKRFGKKVEGYICQDTLEIYIEKNLPLEERVITLLHELIHDIHEDWSEEKVENEARKIYQNLSDRDLGFLEFLVS